MGLIYKYTNLINSKIYIGQTTTSLEERDKKHIYGNNMYIDKAIKKYGRENFLLEVVEDNIPIEELDNKEIYYIKQFSSNVSGIGYNQTRGGNNTINSILSTDIVENIIEDIKNGENFKNIAEKYNVSIYTIYDINNGKSHYNKNIKYPIMKKSSDQSHIFGNRANEIQSMLLNTNIPIQFIASLYNVNEYTVAELNRGTNANSNKNLDYPLRKAIQHSTYQNILTPKIVIYIVRDLIYYHDLTLSDIGKIYGVKPNTIGDISRGISWKEITGKFICPIRENSEENVKIFYSIYGIV